MQTSPAIEIIYYLECARYASRYRAHVPRVGEVVRLRLGTFKIIRVVWIEDDDVSPVPIVAIHIEPEK